MDFDLSTEQKALADSVTRFCEREYGFEARKQRLVSIDGFSRDLWNVIAELGWIGANLTEDDGGFGGSAVDTAVIMEGFGRALVLEPFLSTAILSLQTLAHAPRSAVRDQLLEEIVAGKALVALAYNEPGANGALDQVETTAFRDGAGWTLNGHKSLVIGVQSADVLLVTARAEAGIGLFLVAPGVQNVRILPYQTLDGSRVGDVWFDDVIAQDTIVAPGAALDLVQQGLDYALVGICAEAVGAMSAAITMTRDYVKLRRQFGAALSEFQAVQHRMADMLVELELSRSILYQGLASLALSGPERIKGLSAMKAIVSSAALFVGRNAVQLHGAIGMTEDYPIGHYYRRLFVIAHLFGNESAHIERVAQTGTPFWPAIP
jgi:alkylation response protein AidB-like acyl-CoA dehydrogenase